MTVAARNPLLSRVNALESRLNELHTKVEELRDSTRRDEAPNKEPRATWR